MCLFLFFLLKFSFLFDLFFSLDVSPLFVLFFVYLPLLLLLFFINIFSSWLSWSGFVCFEFDAKIFFRCFCRNSLYFLLICKTHTIYTITRTQSLSSSKPAHVMLNTLFLWPPQVRLCFCLGLLRLPIQGAVPAIALRVVYLPM